MYIIIGRFGRNSAILKDNSQVLSDYHSLSERLKPNRNPDRILSTSNILDAALSKVDKNLDPSLTPKIKVIEEYEANGERPTLELPDRKLTLEIGRSDGDFSRSIFII